MIHAGKDNQDFITSMQKMMRFMNARQREYSEKINRNLL